MPDVDTTTPSMSDSIIRTNHHRRDLIDGSELSEAEREQFDYLDWPAIEAGTDSASFFRFKGDLYSLDTFIRLDATPGWDAGMATSAFNGILIRLVEMDGERYVVVGTQYNS